jgi:hypothetical protein
MVTGPGEAARSRAVVEEDSARDLRTLRAMSAVIGRLGLGLAMLSCACGGARAPEPRAPEFAPESQTKCSVSKSSSRPLIVEWPASDRAQLEAAAKRGVVAVRYEGCEMEVLARCSLPGSYKYTPTTRKLERVAIHDMDELYAELPVGAAKLEGKLAQAGELEVAMHVVGRFDAAPTEDSELEGSCSGATHVITGLTAGAFEFSSGASSSAGAGASVLGAGAGTRAERTKQLINRDGQPDACTQSASDDELPPDGCAALLRVEVTPLADLAVTQPEVAKSATSANTAGPAPVGQGAPDVRPGPGVVRVFIKSPEPVELHGVGISRLEPVDGGFRSLGQSQLLCRGECGAYLDARVGQYLSVGSSEVPFSRAIPLYDREGDVELDVSPGNITSLTFGVTSLSIGVLAAAAGLSLTATGALISSNGSSSSDSDTGADLTKWGLISLAGGAALITVGIVLLNDGSTQVDVRPAAAASVR